MGFRVINKTKSNSLAEHCQLATTFESRNKGLLGTTDLCEDHALWIDRCNCIHTFFMKYAIDCVFVDKNFVVKKIYHNVKPWRLTSPFLFARSVFELRAGSAQLRHVEIGDQLDVVD